LVDGREKFPVHGRKRKMERNWVDHQSKFKMKRRVPYQKNSALDSLGSFRDIRWLGPVHSRIMGWPVKREKARGFNYFLFSFSDYSLKIDLG